MLIDEFLEKYYDNLVKKELNKVVIAPKEMIIDNSEDEDGWIEWKPFEAKTTISEIKNLEANYNIDISRQYIDYCMSSQFMDIQIKEYTLYGINELNTLEKMIITLPKNIISFGFLAIGSINDEDFLALNKDGQVVRLSYDDYSFVEILFDNFNSFIDFLFLKIKI